MQTAEADLSAAFVGVTERLSAASVRHRSDPYRAIAWDEPVNAIDGEDERWELPVWDPLGASEWYRDQPLSRRCHLGLLRVALFFKVGIEFEAVLSQGLLRFASTLPNGHPAFRYVYHETAEEVQHSMMFQEFINRCGMDIPASSENVMRLYDEFSSLSTELPAMFFLAALTGEEVFDHLQRRMLSMPSTHPLFRTITQIHIAEESRHLSFAKAYLRELVPNLERRQQRLLRFRLPFIVEWMSTNVFGAEPLLGHLTRVLDLPEDVSHAIGRGQPSVNLRQRSIAKIVDICNDLDLIDPRLAVKWTELGGDVSDQVTGFQPLHSE